MNEKEIVRSKGSYFKYIAIVLGIIFIVLSIISDKYTYGIYSSNIWLFCLVVLLVLAAFTLLSEMCEIVVTSKKVQGKTMFGKRVDLPLDSITAVSHTSLTHELAITSASGIIKFQLVKDSKKLYEEINKLTSNRQNNYRNEFKKDNLDDLKKLKELLDSGVITEKEFEAKKKKILDL